MWEDPIVAEIHRIRREIMAAFDDDFEAYFRHLQARQQAKERQGVQYHSPAQRPDTVEPHAA